jgi:hypothetical protein
MARATTRWLKPRVVIFKVADGTVELSPTDNIIDLINNTSVKEIELAANIALYTSPS